MRIIHLPALMLFLAALASSPLCAQESPELVVPGEAHPEVRAQLASGESSSAIAALDTALAANGSDPEGLILRGTAHERAGDSSAAWSDYHAGLTLLFTKAPFDASLAAFASTGQARVNGLRVAIAEARKIAIDALAEAMKAAATAGDDEAKRRAAIAILRLDPMHAAAQETLRAYWRDPALIGSWIELFDPSLGNTEQPEGDWESLPNEDGYLVRPNGELVDTAEMLLPMEALEDGHEIEATFEIVAMNNEKARTVSLGFGRGVGCVLAIAIVADSRITVCKQSASALDAIGDPLPAALPSEGRPFTMKLSVHGGNLHVFIDGKEVGVREGIGKDLKDLPLQIATQNTEVRMTRIRARHFTPGTAEPDKDAIKEAEKLVKKKDPGCLDEVDNLLIDAPDNVALLMLRAQAAAALERPREALIAYRRAHDQTTDKKLQKEIEKGIEELAVELSLEKIMDDYVKAVDAAVRAAPRDFAAGKLRALEVIRQVRVLEKGDLKDYEKAKGDAKSEVEWIDIALDVGERSSVLAGDWRAADGAIEGSSTATKHGELLLPLVTSDAFSIQFEHRVLVKNKAEGSVQLAVGEPLLAWVQSYPEQRFGLLPDAAAEKKEWRAKAKKRRTVDDQWHTTTIVVEGGFTTFSLDGERIYHTSLPHSITTLAGAPVRLRTESGPMQFRNLRYRDRY